MPFINYPAAICYMLENWSGMDKQKTKTYILNCQVCLKNDTMLTFVCLLCCPPTENNNHLNAFVMTFL